MKLSDSKPDAGSLALWSCVDRRRRRLTVGGRADELGFWNLRAAFTVQAW